MGDIGQSFEVTVTAKNVVGEASATSPETSATEGTVQPPENVLAPTITGLAVTGQTVHATEGVWNGTEPTFAYQWELCNSSGGACAEITGAQSQEFTIPDGDAGHTLRVTVTAGNAAGSAAKTSEPSSEIVGVGPANTELPTVSGTPTAGQLLTASSGKWSGTEPITFEYEWLRCNTTGTGCTQAAAPSVLPTYSVAGADVGHKLRVNVIAKNIAGTGAAESEPTALVAGVLPSNVLAPIVTGLAVTGQTLTATEGTWTGNEPITYSFRWQLCTKAGTGCGDISGATKSTYVIADEDATHTLRVIVTAKNVAGSTEKESATTIEVLGLAPKNTELPTVSGTATAGQILTAASGKWSGTEPITFEYEWLRCNTGGTGCTQAAAPSVLPTYSVVAADVGHTLRANVIATNIAGKGEKESAPTATVGGVKPSNTIAPTALGLAVTGQTLTATEGTWTGTEPITYAFRWQQCSKAGTECGDISGETKSTYVIKDADAGHTLRVVVTAKNVAGSTEKESATTSEVLGVAPKNTEAPAVSGEAKEGQLLTASSGKWSGTEPITFEYEWLRCNAAGESCVQAAGKSILATYSVVAADVGKTLRAKVYAKNIAGTGEKESAATATVKGVVPTNTVLPLIVGTATSGATVEATEGTWTGTQPITYEVEWKLCVSATSCKVEQSGPFATAKKFKIPSGSSGKKLRLNVLRARFAPSKGLTVRYRSDTIPTCAGGGAGDDEGELPVPPRTREGLRRFAGRLWVIAALVLGVTATAGAQAASAAPVNLSPPVVKGKTSDGKKLKASPGSWSGGKPSFSYAWERCDGAGENCAPVAGAGAAYQTSDADVGHRLVAIVTATNGEGSAAKATAPSANIVPVGPKKKKAPTISGTTKDGQMVSAATGTWRGTGPLSFAYQWESCRGKACTSITGATGQSYRAGTPDLSKKLRVIVTASNVAGSGTATSKPSAVVTAGAPVNVAAPSVAGLPIVEQTLTAEPGTWAGTGPFTATSPPSNLISALLPSNLELPSITGLLGDGGLLSVLTGAWSGSEPLSFSYLWELCDSAGQNCKEISGALAPTLGLIAGDIGSTLRVIVTATNSAGSATATSEPTSLVGGLLPSNTGLPSITGLLQDGSALTAVLGSWSGSGPLSFSQVWELCDSSGQNCKAIEGAVGSTLGLIAGEIGSTARLAVTATNSTGSTTAYSEPTSLIKGLLPSNTGLPTIVGSLIDGSALTGAVGGWSGSEPLSFSRQWLLCDSSGGSCKEISGATSTTVGLLTSMIGSTMREVVTATDSSGSTSATSEPTSVIKALLPSNTGLPSIVGSLIDGSALTGSKGTWTGSEPSFSYQWLLCNGSGAACKEISGATGTTLGLLTGMIGSTTRLVVTATNGAGSTSATSEPTSVIKALLPSNSGLPSITGSLIDGSALTGGKGSWTGSEPSFSYQWLLCNSSGAACKEISGATGTTIGLLTSMIGSTTRLVVTATNSAGSTSATSEPTSVVKALLPANTALPSVTGLLEDGQSLTGAKGSWTGSEPSFSYQWLLCNGSGAACKEISGATGATLGLLTSMIGSTTRLVVTATNGAGSTTATSGASSPILAILSKNTALPSISGLVEAAQTVTGAKGSWSGSEPTFTYQWLLCNSSGASCSEISGATATTLGLFESQIGKTVRLAVTAANSRGATTATSEPTSSILAILPANSAVPTIAGILQVGKVLEAVAGGKWTGSTPLNITYQWQTCGLLGKESECTNIGGAVSKLLKLELLQVGLTIRVIETATNARGAVSKSSAITSTVLGLL